MRNIDYVFSLPYKEAIEYVIEVKRRWEGLNEREINKNYRKWLKEERE